MARGHWRTVGALAVLVLLGGAAACSGPNPQWRSPSGEANGGIDSGGGTTSAPPAASQFTVVPAADAKNVSPAEPVTVGLSGGTLETVTLTNPEGKAVKGEFAADKTSWRSTEDLGYNKRYTVKAAGQGADGQRAEVTHAFTTVKPKNFTLPYLRANDGILLNGGTFGVGQPIVVRFDEPIKDKAAAERTLSVTTQPAVVGAWYWMDDREVHWRPREYWPAGTKVKVVAKVYGKHFGGGLYGQEDRSASFTIGRSKIAVADSKTHRMKVYVDGVQVKKIAGKDITAGIPISMGKGGSEIGANGQVVSFTTNSGPHVITLKYEVYRMTSASFGITNPSSGNFYDVPIKKSIRISGDGEFVHLRDWETYQLGKVNTSHGCVNVGAPYIYWFYDNFGAGDIVDVTGTSAKLALRNGLGDWTLSWAQWQKGSALS